MDVEKILSDLSSGFYLRKYYLKVTKSQMYSLCEHFFFDVSLPSRKDFHFSTCKSGPFYYASLVSFIDDGTYIVFSLFHYRMHTYLVFDSSDSVVCKSKVSKVAVDFEYLLKNGMVSDYIYSN